MKPVTIHEAKTNLSKLIARAEAGEEIVIARGKDPVAKIVPIAKPKARRKFGSMKGLIKIDDRFFEPLPEEELRRWEGYED
jgi:prevent-host-death family protein